MNRIRKGDEVVVIAGRDKGRRGTVVKVVDEEHVIVEGVNVVKRHTKPRPLRDSSRMGAQQIAPGGVLEKAGPVPVSAVMLVCPTCGRATRVGISVKDVKGEQVKVRQCKRVDCMEEIDQ